MIGLTMLNTLNREALRPETLAVIEARAAVVTGVCTSPVVILALETLERVYALRCDASEVERLERYVLDAWSEHTGGDGPSAATLPLPSTEPCPRDQSAPIAPTRSDLAALALAAGVDRSDVREFVSGRYSFRRSDIGLIEASL
jgi:hypothetical protein